MLNPEKIIQVKAFARQDGALLTLLWTLSFAFVMFLPQSVFGNLLAIATPFFIGWRLSKFRDYALDGILSVRRGYAYGVYTFFYASLLFALVQFLYFRFLDHGRFSMLIAETMNTLAPIYEKNGIPRSQLDEMTNTITGMSPLYWATTFMLQNIFIGLLASLPIAAVCAKRARFL